MGLDTVVPWGLCFSKRGPEPHVGLVLLSWPDVKPVHVDTSLCETSPRVPKAPLSS